MNTLRLIGIAGMTALFLSAGCAKDTPQDAQQTYRHEGRMAGHSMMGAPGALYELLDLTEVQKGQVADILEKYAPRHRRDGRRDGGRHTMGRRGNGPGDGRPGEKRHGNGTCDEPGAHRHGNGTCDEPGAHRHGSGPGDGKPGGKHRGSGPCDGPADEPCAKDMKAHREKVHAEIMAVLTPAQQQKAKALKAQLDKGIIPQELIDLRIRRLNDLLALNDDQKTKLSALMKEKGAKLKECRDACEGRKECGAKPRELGRAYMDGVKGILTAAQWETYTEHFKRRLHEKGGEFGHMRKLIRDLDLTDAQKGQLKVIMKNVFKEDKPPRGDHDAMQAHHEKVRAKIRAILTAEQQKKFDTMKPPHRHGPTCGGKH